ncbi:hypothetical protein AAE478_009966 [Parahypoxylon ruwenzoriense]
MESPTGSTSSFDEVNPTPGIIDTPGIFTPGTPVTFSIKYHEVELKFPLASSDATHLDEHRRSFLNSLTLLESDIDDKKPMSGAALTFKFLEHLLRCSVPPAFGGQSSNNPACVDDFAELYSLYRPLVEPLVASLGAVLNSLSRHSDTKAFYQGREIDLPAWLDNPASRPDKSFLSSAAVSFPIIGLTGLLHYCIICKVLGKTPAELGQVLSGVTGHSQGIVVAAAVAKSHSWESFFIEARWAVELLFWMGYESQMAAPQSPMSTAMINDSVQSGDGVPSHMLLVRGMRQQQLEDTIAASNKHLPEHEHIYLSLINSPENLVVAGPPRSLRGLVLRLREICARAGLDQSRVPYSKRKPVIVLQFLPINSPFHSTYLQEAAERIYARIASSWPETMAISSLRIPVLYTENGEDLRKAYEHEADINHLLIDAVTTKTVDWPKTLQATRGSRPSHIIALGSKRFSDMIRENTDGYGVRVIDGVRLDMMDSITVGVKAEIFAQTLPSSKMTTASWSEQFKPILVRSSDGTYTIETRLNRILKAPFIITAGMTLTTVPWDFVAAVIRAGYHIELAGGGYHSLEVMKNALEKIAADILVGRGIICNVIYVDLKAIAF